MNKQVWECPDCKTVMVKSDESPLTVLTDIERERADWLQESIDKTEQGLPACKDGFFNFKDTPWAMLGDIPLPAISVTWKPDTGWLANFSAPGNKHFYRFLSWCYTTRDAAIKHERENPSLGLLDTDEVSR